MSTNFNIHNEYGAPLNEKRTNNDLQFVNHVVDVQKQKRAKKGEEKKTIPKRFKVTKTFNDSLCIGYIQKHWPTTNGDGNFGSFVDYVFACFQTGKAVTFHGLHDETHKQQDVTNCNTDDNVYPL